MGEAGRWRSMEEEGRLEAGAPRTRPAGSRRSQDTADWKPALPGHGLPEAGAPGRRSQGALTDGLTSDDAEIAEGVDHELARHSGQQQAHDARGDLHGNRVKPPCAPGGKAESHVGS